MNIKITSLALLSVVAAGAQAVDFKVIGQVSGLNAGVKVKYFGNSQEWNAGPFNSLRGGVESLTTYCVDLAHTTDYGTTYNANEFFGDSLGVNGHLVGRIFNKFQSTVDTATEGAALQMAIWDALTDGGDGFASGNFKDNGTNSAIITQANAYLTADLTGVSQYVRVWKATSHPNGKHQHQLGVVPEPASIIALGLGAAAMIRRRRAAKK